MSRSGAMGSSSGVALLTAADMTAERTRTAGTYEPIGLSAATRIGLGQASIDTLPTPFYTAHRGGAGIAPEQTLEAGDVSLALGVHVLDWDANRLADGAVGIMHDDTVDRTTTATGNTSAFTTMQWPLLAADASSWFAPAWPSAMQVPLAGQVLNRFGGRCVNNIEAKTSNIVSALCSAVVKRGLQAGTWINTNRVADVPTIKAAGCRSYVYFTSAANMVSGIAAAVAALPDAIELRADATDPQIASAVATIQAANAGIKILGGVADTRYDRDRLVAAGCQGIVTNEPGYLLGVTTPRTSDTWSSKTYGHGYVPTTSTQSRHTFQGTDEIEHAQAGAQSELVGEVCPIANPAAYTVSVDTKWTVLPTDMTRHVDLHVGVDDRLWTGAVTGGYTAYVRANGQMSLFREDANGTSTLIASKTTGVVAMVAGDTHRYVLTISASAVTFTDQFTGFSITANDTTYRNLPYLWLARNSTTGAARLRALAIS